MVDPWMSGNGERIKIIADEVVALQQVLRIPHVPPDVGVVDINAVDRKNVLQTNENKGENR